MELTPNDKKDIAILMTCHNRKEVTLACLSNLHEIEHNADIYLVDDNSTDGTYDAVSKRFPFVNIIKGNGHLFWCRGMNCAWKEARRNKDYGFYIWLNDDMTLYANAFKELFFCSEEMKHEAIITGLVQGKVSKKVIYGAFDKNRRLIEANGMMNDVQNLNGNFVLVPKFVYDQLGFFDEHFHHDIGDVDYGLSAKKKGIKVVTTRVYIGATDEGLKSKNLRIRKHGVSVSKRFKYLYSPLGANPRIHFYFDRKHGSVVKGILSYLYLHFINVLPDNVFDYLFPRYKKG